ncbi:hypothetical protein ACTFIW_005495 [Dictyostelium discoideum]
MQKGRLEKLVPLIRLDIVPHYEKKGSDKNKSQGSPSIDIQALQFLRKARETIVDKTLWWFDKLYVDLPISHVVSVLNSFNSFIHSVYEVTIKKITQAADKIRPGLFHLALEHLHLIPAFVFLSVFNTFKVDRRRMEKFSAQWSLYILQLSSLYEMSSCQCSLFSIALVASH